MPQRRLLELLRVDIDRAMEGDTRARNRLVRLTWDNPRSIHSTHVAYNLGREKYRWLVREVLPDARLDRSPLVRPKFSPGDRELADGLTT
jgi:hypothetical protein